MDLYNISQHQGNQNQRHNQKYHWVSHIISNIFKPCKFQHFDTILFRIFQAIIFIKVSIIIFYIFNKSLLENGKHFEESFSSKIEDYLKEVFKNRLERQRTITSISNCLSFRIFIYSDYDTTLSSEHVGRVEQNRVLLSKLLIIFTDRWLLLHMQNSCISKVIQE